MSDLKLSSDMQLLSEVIGEELTVKVIAELSGISIYVPKPDYSVIRLYHERLGGSVKKTAQTLGVSERMVYRAIQSRQLDDAQMTIFDAIALFEQEEQQQKNRQHDTADRD